MSEENDTALHVDGRYHLDRHFAKWLAAVVAVGVLARIVYTLTVAPHGRGLSLDSQFYVLSASNLRRGLGYIDLARQTGVVPGHPELRGRVATAGWPPLYPALLALVQTLVGTAKWRASQLAGAFIGGGTIALTGILGRMVADRMIGLVAASIAALSPYLIAVDGSLMSETLAVPLVLLVLVFLQRARERPTLVRWGLVGVAIGLAALTRGDALVLVFIGVIPIVFLTDAPMSQVLPRAIASVVVTCLVLAPWVIRNANAVGDPTISTISSEAVFAVANNDIAYGEAPPPLHDRIGYDWFFSKEDSVRIHVDEAATARSLRDKGLRYAFAHAERWPVVLPARALRLLGLWDPVQQTMLESYESRTRGWQYVVWVASLATLLLGVMGFVLLGRRRRPIYLVVAPVASAIVIGVLTYGNTRFRAPAEPALIIGMAASLVIAVRRVRRRRVARPTLRE